MIFFSATQLNKNDYEFNWNLKFYSRIIHFTDFLFILILSIDKTSFFREPYEEKTSYTVLGGGSFSSTSIPMSRLSNRCNWCSIPKRRKRSSESGFLWSDQESNLFKRSRYSLFPWKRCSTYRNCSGYFKKGRGFALIKWNSIKLRK